MTIARRSFRIESMSGALVPPRVSAVRPAQKPNRTAEPRLEDILASLKELKSFLDPSQRLASDVIDAYRREIAEVFKVRLEFDRMKEAIESTKIELAAIRALETEGQGMHRVNSELDEVVSDTERATTSILAATEEIEAQMRPLGASLTSAMDKKRLEIVFQKVVALYESCNFHDVTGQRIAKIVRTLKFLEDRLATVIDAWSGLDAFRGFAEDAPPMLAALGASPPVSTPRPPAFSPQPRVHEELLNGPKLPKDSGHASQAEIDAMFS